jgi:hypothetical protein
MNSLDISLNLFGKSEKKELISYIEIIQKKFIEKIEKSELENEKIKFENKELKEKIELSNKENIEYFNKLSNIQECLKIQVKTNEQLLKIIKDNEKSFSSSLLNYFY